MLYDIRLRLSYDYAGTASGGRHVACLMPADEPGQQRIHGRLTIDPAPADLRERVDFFGNRLTDFALPQAHGALSVTLVARVARPPGPGLPGGATPLDLMSPALQADTDLGPRGPLHFRAPSPRVPLSEAITAFARDQTAPGMTALDAALALSQAIHREMVFDPQATTVDTPAAAAFANRRGVCQDFSHVMIAGLRGLGIPAAYVSGFLRTIPPPGTARLEGADAMHAWVAVWCGPVAGWVELDPTNDMAAGTDHIIVARGRDYADVSPLKGILRVAGGQTIAQAVDVIPLD